MFLLFYILGFVMIMVIISGLMDLIWPEDKDGKFKNDTEAVYKDFWT